MVTDMIARRPVVSSKIYHAVKDDVEGKLAQIDGHITFITDDTMEVVTIEELNFIAVLGLCDLTETAALLDSWHGGLVTIACSRPN